jgi:hypothetical protein
VEQEGCRLGLVVRHCSLSLHFSPSLGCR